MCDDVGDIFLTKNPIIITRSKHIAFDFHFVREQVEDGLLKVSPVSSSDQLVDIFTKPLGKACVTHLSSKLQLQPALELVR